MADAPGWAGSSFIAAKFGRLDELAAVEAYQQNCARVLTGEMWIAMHVLADAGMEWDRAARQVDSYCLAGRDDMIGLAVRQATMMRTMRDAERGWHP